MACSTVEQLVGLSPPQLDALLDLMRLLPGRRQALRAFIASLRRAGADADGGAPGRSCTSRQRSRWDAEWRMTHQAVVLAARQRERSCEFGPSAHLTNAPHLNWGRPLGAARVKPPSSAARASAVRVLHVGRSRVVDYGGQLVW